ncbi:MAG: MFS transporter [Lachnospiraceae bacterium]|nr:MFS transporter [uncultured Schaedlerella sp.]MCI9066855.1 MFS transporter [Lachnospiraceae bacterium]MCI9442936.1 MFS transporter [Ruminococcus sp.]
MELKLKNKIGYSLGTLAKDLISPIWGSYLMFFYTDVFGISGTAAGLLLFVARIWDAINDPMMGVIVDKTKTKWGRYRPYILIAPIPLYIFAILTFTVPNLAPTGKLIWAYVTYIGTGMAFTAYDVPMWGLLSTLTRSENDRNQMISLLRNVSTAGYLVMVYATLPLVSILGNGSQAAGFRNLMIVLCVISYLFALICFFSTKEQYNTESNAASLKDMIKSLIINRPLMVLIICMAVMYIFMNMPSAVGTYFIMYNLGAPELIGIGLMIPTLASFIGIFIAPAVAKKLGGKKTIIVGFAAYFILGVLGFFLASSNFYAYAAVSVLQGICCGLPNVLLSTYIVDCSDWAEWKYGVRCDGTAFSLQSFAIKAGQALSGAIGGFVLGMTGYVAGEAVQSAAVITGLSAARYLAPAALAVITAGIMMLYPITSELKAQITKELEERRAKE